MEKNREILKKALRQMRWYEPLDDCWNAIGNALEEKQAPFLSVKLNTFSPPGTIWENIDRRLAAKKPSPIKNRAILFLKWSSVAAAGIILGFIIYIIFERQNKLTYSEEWVAAGSFQPATGNDSLTYLALDEKCKIQPTICQSYEFLEMKKELDFLDESKKTITERLNKYDPDQELEIMLTRIDMEREEILGQLIEFSN